MARSLIRENLSRPPKLARPADLDDGAGIATEDGGDGPFEAIGEVCDPACMLEDTVSYALSLARSRMLHNSIAWRISDWVGSPARADLMCFNFTAFGGAVVGISPPGKHVHLVPRLDRPRRTPLHSFIPRPRRSRISPELRIAGSSLIVGLKKRILIPSWNWAPKAESESENVHIQSVPRDWLGGKKSVTRPMILTSLLTLEVAVLISVKFGGTDNAIF